MKNPYIILKEDELYLEDLPEKPTMGECFSMSEYEDALEKYYKVCDQAVKDAVKLKDQSLGNELRTDLPFKYSLWTKNHPYKVDLSGYDVTFKEWKDQAKCTACKIDCLHSLKGIECKAPINNVAILTPILPPKKDGSLCGMFPSVSKDKSIVDHNKFYEIEKKENSAHSLDQLVSRLGDSLQNIIEIGKRDMRNPKYDGYFRDADEALEAYANHCVNRKPSAAEESQERFTKPTDKQIIEIAILFNHGKLEPDKLADMVAMSEFIIDRLYENGNCIQKSSKED